ncbi:MAG: hypothetical protein ACYDAY_02060 [Candidatus Dormibacteria bacterium]
MDALRNFLSVDLTPKDNTLSDRVRRAMLWGTWNPWTLASLLAAGMGPFGCRQFLPLFFALAIPGWVVMLATRKRQAPGNVPDVQPAHRPAAPPASAPILPPGIPAWVGRLDGSDGRSARSGDGDGG